MTPWEYLRKVADRPSIPDGQRAQLRELAELVEQRQPGALSWPSTRRDALVDAWRSTRALFLALGLAADAEYVDAELDGITTQQELQDNGEAGGISGLTRAATDTASELADVSGVSTLTDPTLTPQQRVRRIQLAIVGGVVVVVAFVAGPTLITIGRRWLRALRS